MAKFSCCRDAVVLLFIK